MCWTPGRVIALVLVSTVVLCLALPYLWPRREPPALVPLRQVAAADNGWTLLVEATILLDRDHPAQTADQRGAVNPAAGDALRANAAALAKLREALAKPDLQAPHRLGLSADPAAAEAEMKIMAGVRELSRLLAQQAYARQQSGDLPGALAAHRLNLRLGQRLCAADVTAIGYLVGIATEAIAARGVQISLIPGPWPTGGPDRLAAVTSPPARLSVGDRRAWRELGDWLGEPLDYVGDSQRMLTAEAESMVTRLDDLAAGRVADPVSGRPAHALRVPSILFDRRQTADLVRRGCADLQTEFAKPFARQTMPPPIRATFGYNLVGRQLAAQSMPTMRGVAAKTIQRQANRLATRGLIALRLYFDDHQRLPRDWAELVAAGLLPRVPVDPYDGQPLRYDPTRPLIWSVGDDLVDDGGRNPKSDYEPDLIWRVPLPATPR